MPHLADKEQQDVCRVESVEPGSPAMCVTSFNTRIHQYMYTLACDCRLSDVRAGDVVGSVNGVGVISAAQAIKLIKASPSKVLLTLLRDSANPDQSGLT